VLLIGAHPDDEDTNLMAWLSRGRFIETAYLSLTRGDGGQNVIGNELGEALGVVRTEELFAARGIDGAQQYFTRAYDFGFSKDTADTWAQWPRDSILGDVVRIVREFRPHVVIGIFSGTPRDGHGQHQATGIVAREAYDLSADTARFPVARYGTAWTPLKFYRAARGNAEAGTLGMDVGEYSPLRGESYGEIAGRSRSQHKSQAFGALERKGAIMNYVRREASRVNDATAPTSERSIFDGIDTTWSRFRPHVRDPRRREALDALPMAFAALRKAYDPFQPATLVPMLAETGNLLGWLCPGVLTRPCADAADRDPQVEADLNASVSRALWRVVGATGVASGVAIEAAVAREVVPVGMPTTVRVALYNRSADTIDVSGPMRSAMSSFPATRRVPPRGVLRDSLVITIDSLTQPWWLARGRRGAAFLAPASASPGSRPSAAVAYVAMVRGHAVPIVAPVQYRYADDVRGDIRRAVAAAPAISITLGEERQYARANTPLDREVAVRLLSADTASREVRVSLQLPQGLAADSATRSAVLSGHGAVRTLMFRVRGRLPPGLHRIAASAESNGQRFDVGYALVDYEHISRQYMYRPAVTLLSAVDVRVPPALRVGYITGVSDNVAPSLVQLGVPVTVLAPRDLASTDLTRFTTIVVGPRAYDAFPELVSANQRLLDFARRGGTLVVQYGQYEMTQPGLMPHAITIHRPHDRVTHETSPVRMLNADEPVLSVPNRISAQDFEGWVQERSLYMPRTFDDRYRVVLEMQDPGEQANRGAILVAPLGQGTYVYTTLALFRQLPAGVAGAARLMVNLLSAGQPPATP